ncbi:MAG: transporter substrate-binding domain-containing protein [Sulfuriflexus sp.]|nr:transporter substrate-binding domain-containing protein [Sulfuriflexus sp.]
MVGVSAQADAVKNRNNSRTLLVAVPEHVPPQYNLDNKGKPIGFAIDVLTHVTEHLGFNVEYKIQPDWTATFKALKDGKVDLIPNLGISQARLEHYDYTRSVEAVPIHIFVRDSETQITEAKDLVNKKVGSVKGNISIGLIENIPGATIVVYDSVEKMLIGLLSTDVDAIIYPLPWTLYTARRAGLDSRIKKVSPSIFEVKRAMAVRKGNKKLLDSLNNELERLISTDEYQNLYTKWYGEEKPYWSIKRVLLVGGSIVAAIFILMFILHYRIILRSNKAYKESVALQQTTETRLHEEQALLRALIDSVPDLIFLKDENSVYLGCNKAFADYFGRAESEWLGKSDLDFFPKEEAELFQNNDRKMLTSGEQLQNKEWLPAADGRKLLFETLKTPFYGPNGNILGLIGISRDISVRSDAELALKKSEELYSQLVNNSPAGVWQLDENEIITFVNQSCANILELDNPEDAIGMSMADFLTEWSQEKVTNDENKFTYNLSGQYELDIVGKKGGLKKVLLAGAPVMSADSKNRSWVSTIIDITGEVEQQKKLRRSQKMDALGKLTGGVAHDFNNMLNVIIGYAEILYRNLDDDSANAHFVKEIKNAGQRGAALTRKLLSFSGQASSGESLININSILEDDINMLSKTMTARIHVALKLDDELWLTRVDKGELEDVLLNLSINAMHAMSGSGRVTYATLNESLDAAAADNIGLSGAGDYVRLSVIDTGIGMPQEVVSKIFDPFFTTKGDQGTGLGLSQVYGFVERCNGAIIVDSTVGSGTEFSLYFPRSIEALEANEEEQAASDNDSMLSGTETVLVVDDETALLGLAQNVLKNAGYKVYCAEGADSALWILSRNKVDIMVSDVIMPGTSGVELARQVEGLYPDMKIQLVSGYVGSYNDDTKNSSYMKTLLDKPYTADTLLTRVRELLDS